MKEDIDILVFLRPDWRPLDSVGFGGGVYLDPSQSARDLGCNASRPGI